MRKIVLLLFISLFATACKKDISASDIAKINGYWEIEKVIFPDGNKKDYKVNETFDYFEIKENKGFRKKVSPQLDGTFLVNDAFEQVKILNLNGKYLLQYSTSFSKWQEELLEISDQELVMVNDSKNEYHYKRAAPINILGNGQKTQ